MSPLKRSNNIAARMGRWSAGHWKTATFGWLAFVVLAAALGTALGTKTLIAEKSGNGESGKAAAIAYDKFRHSPEETILIQSKTLTTGDTAFKAAVADTVARFGGKPYVKSVDSPYAPGNEGQISSDRHSALVTFKLREKDLTRPTSTSRPCLPPPPPSSRRIPASPSTRPATRPSTSRSTTSSARIWRRPASSRSR